MFDIDNPSDDKAKLIDAVACSFASCQTEGEYQVVKMCIVEFFSAISNAGSIDDFSGPERGAAELMYHLANAYIANYELLLKESGE